MNQDAFAKIGDVARNAQSRYETGATEPSAAYLANLAVQGVDVLWVLTGVRGGTALDPEQSAWLDAFINLAPADRATMLRLTASLAGRPAPLIPLPSTAALEAALGGFLQAKPGLAGVELVHELATSLPTIVQAADAHAPAADMAAEADWVDAAADEAGR